MIKKYLKLFKFFLPISINENGPGMRRDRVNME